jgi:hypothetical protein
MLLFSGAIFVIAAGTIRAVVIIVVSLWLVQRILLHYHIESGITNSYLFSSSPGQQAHEAVANGRAARPSLRS